MGRVPELRERHRYPHRHSLYNNMDYRLTLLLMPFLLLGSSAITCFSCDSNPLYHNYDANCNSTDYNGITTATTAVGCAIEVFEDGNVWRGVETRTQATEDDRCQRVYDSGYAMRCWCYGSITPCNSYLCEECFDTNK